MSYSLVNSSKKSNTEEKPPYSYVALIAMAIEVCLLFTSFNMLAIFEQCLKFKQI